MWCGSQSVITLCLFVSHFYFILSTRNILIGSNDEILTHDYHLVQRQCCKDVLQIVGTMAVFINSDLKLSADCLSFVS